LAVTAWLGTAIAAEAPGAPGAGSAWTTGAKQGLGTSTTPASKVWYTLGQGITHEVYYPQVDTPNVQDLQFIVTDGSAFVDLERDATDHQVQLVDPSALIYRQINTAHSGKYRITKTYLTDPDRSTLLIDTRFEALSGGPYQLYVLYNPSLNGSGLGDTAASQGDALVASDGHVASALMVSGGFSQRSSGSSSDGLVDLNADKRLDNRFDSASAPGNIVQIGQLNVGSDTDITLALGFGQNRLEALANAQISLATPFSAHQAKYADGWHGYLAALRPAPNSRRAGSIRGRTVLCLGSLIAPGGSPIMLARN
jgi:glucoamylase